MAKTIADEVFVFGVAWLWQDLKLSKSCYNRMFT